MTGNKTIFLADDDMDDRFLLREAIGLIDNQITIVEATDGTVLLDLIRNAGKINLALILLDMNMPKMNGLETIAAIRSDPYFSLIPAVMITTSSDPGLARQAIEAGITSFMTKPNSFEGFIDLARQLAENFLV